MSRSRCAYLYDDGEQCVWEGQAEMCPAHVVIRQQEKRAERHVKQERARQARVKAKKAKPVSKVQAAKEIIGKLPAAPTPHPRGDASAPWCSCRVHTYDEVTCEVCRKPTYTKWARARGA